MNKRIDTIKGILLIIILLVLVLPIIQEKFKFIHLRPLKGAIIEPQKEYFSLKTWFSGEYQENEEKYINETFGFRNLFIRINNQIAFWMFNKAKANGVIIGKKNYLFEENYIKAYYGTDFVGVDSITTKIKKLKFIQDTLSKLNKNLIIVFAAGKGSYYPEYFPDKYKSNKGKTNYEYYVKLAQQYDLHFIDFNNYFCINKGISKYPLYPQYGIHWSYYGASFAADSIIKTIENLRNIKMPHIHWDNIRMDDAKDIDYDIGDGMNLLLPLKSFKMAYPELEFDFDSQNTKPSSIVISDSFYWIMFNFGISKVFSDSHFWFYNTQIYPDSYTSPLETSQVNLKEEINKHDVFIIMATEATLPKLGWGFIEKTYDLYTKN